MIVTTQWNLTKTQLPSPRPRVRSWRSGSSIELSRALSFNPGERLQTKSEHQKVAKKWLQTETCAHLTKSLSTQCHSSCKSLLSLNYWKKTYFLNFGFMPAHISACVTLTTSSQLIIIKTTLLFICSLLPGPAFLHFCSFNFNLAVPTSSYLWTSINSTKPLYINFYLPLNMSILVTCSWSALSFLIMSSFGPSIYVIFLNKWL